MAGIFTLLAKEKGLVLAKAVQILSINFLREEGLRALSALLTRDG